jgi:hypothetical protein
LSAPTVPLALAAASRTARASRTPQSWIRPRGRARRRSSPMDAPGTWHCRLRVWLDGHRQCRIDATELASLPTATHGSPPSRRVSRPVACLAPWRTPKSKRATGVSLVALHRVARRRGRLGGGGPPGLAIATEDGGLPSAGAGRWRAAQRRRRLPAGEACGHVQEETHRKCAHSTVRVVLCQIHSIARCRLSAACARFRASYARAGGMC